MSTTNLETIAEEFFGVTGRFGLYKRDDKVLFAYYCVFDEDNDDVSNIYGYMLQEDYRKGIDALAETGYCKIPTEECRKEEEPKSCLEMEIREKKIMVSFRKSAGYQSEAMSSYTSNWAIDHLRI